jgi:MoxR-like ATPase
MTAWPMFKGNNEPCDAIQSLPSAPPWRQFAAGHPRGETFQASREEIRAVNAALFLRRPLLITGKPGTGKTSLAYAVAHELKLGTVLRWSITSRSTLSEGLYRYDAIGRMQDAQLHRGRTPRDRFRGFGARHRMRDAQLRQAGTPDIGKYLRLGPLGTALLPSSRPRVLLVDELDKSDIDLPNDLLNIFEEGEYEIPELARLEQREVSVRLHESSETFPIPEGKVRCKEFPFVVITSNGEREFPPPFLRRCLRLDIDPPDRDKLARIVRAHLGESIEQQSEELVTDFLHRRTTGDIATDQLLNAIFLVTERKVTSSDEEREELKSTLLRALGSSQML